MITLDKNIRGMPSDGSNMGRLVFLNLAEPAEKEKRQVMVLSWLYYNRL